jgi:mRNA-degrading endonuclease RelE of RelBE toxin-antitoxin system
LPRCEIDLNACPHFLPLVNRLRRKKYRKIQQDLASVFEEIEKDYGTAAGAASIPGWDGAVWKHRCGSSDTQSGRRGGFRIISVVDDTTDPHTLYPVLIYPKSEKADVSAVEVAEAVKGLRQELELLQKGLGLPEPDEESGPPDPTA